jgi:hypothetical protein
MFPVPHVWPPEQAFPHVDIVPVHGSVNVPAHWFDGHDSSVQHVFDAPHV